jgi:hypothetical protein
MPQKKKKIEEEEEEEVEEEEGGEEEEEEEGDEEDEDEEEEGDEEEGDEEEEDESIVKSSEVRKHYHIKPITRGASQPETFFAIGKTDQLEKMGSLFLTKKLYLKFSPKKTNLLYPQTRKRVQKRARWTPAKSRSRARRKSARKKNRKSPP